MSVLPILTGQIKARACDRAMEEKDGAGGFRAGEETKGGGQMRRQRRQRKMVKEVEERWSRTMWPGETTNSKRSHI